jgi:flotillin
LYKAVPPLKDIFDMAGMDLPSYLGQSKNNHDEGAGSEIIVKE